MSYQKQNFANGEVLTAAQLNHIENGIADVESSANATKGVVDNIIDPTLSLSGKAADAKATGDKIGELKEDLEGLDNIINLYNGTAIEIKNFGFSVDKSSTEATSHLYTNNIPFAINIDGGYKYCVYEYSKTGEAIKSIPFTTEEYTITDKCYKCMIVVKLIDGGKIYDLNDIQNNITVKSILKTNLLGLQENKIDAVELYGGEKSAELKLISAGTRISVTAIAKKSDIFIKLTNEKYYMFVTCYNENNKPVENSLNWATNTTLRFNRVYKYEITIKKGVDGTDEFTESDIKDVYSSLSVTQCFSSIVDKVYSIETNVVYVDVGGDDKNDGSIDNPVATLSNAISKGSVIVINAGKYNDSLSVKNKKSVTIMASPNKNSDNDSVEISTSSTNVLDFTNVLNVRLVGIKFTGASNDVVKLTKCGNLYAQGCEFNNSLNGNGLELIGTNALIYSCKAIKNKNDGFNMNNYGDSVFVNCEGCDNIEGDGLSHHNNCTGFVNGGYWHDNGKAGISTPTYGAAVNISNAFCIANKYGMQVFGGDAVADNTIHVKLDNVVFKDNSIAGVQVDKYIVDLVNCKFSGNTEDKLIVSGTVNEF